MWVFVRNNAWKSTKDLKEAAIKKQMYHEKQAKMISFKRPQNE